MLLMLMQTSSIGPFPIWLLVTAMAVLVTLAPVFWSVVMKRPIGQNLSEAMKKTRKFNLGVSDTRLREHHRIGNVVDVVDALIAARQAKINLSWDTATMLDMAGQNPVDAVAFCGKTQVYEIPSSTTCLNPIAQDGIELNIRLRMRCRPVITKLVGGSSVETLIARLGKTVIEEVGQSPDHRQVISQQGQLCMKWLKIELDQGTAFELLTLEFTHLQAGRNVGAELLANKRAHLS